MRRVQQGFTLIELVVVIVILGILAATALPRFVDLGSDARRAVVQSVEGSLRSANMMIYAKAATAGQLGATGTVSVNGTNITTAYGFASTIAQLTNAAVMDLDTTKFTVDTTNSRVTYTSATTPATCSVTYTAATAGTAPPQYVTAVAGC